MSINPNKQRTYFYDTSTEEVVSEYKAFNTQQKVISDFDKFVKKHS